MTAMEIVATLRRRGVMLAPSPDGRIRYRPRDGLSSLELEQVARHRDEIRMLLEREAVDRRIAAMAPQLASAGAIPMLLARPGVQFPNGTCCSCGDLLASGQHFRCRPCVEAAVAVLAEATDP
jgi:hypothetical protein